MSAERSLQDVCTSVADGTAVDWRRLDSKADSQDARDLLAQLQVVADLAGAHRVIEDDSERTRSATVGAARPEPEGELSRWGRYQLAEQLGRGTFGRVHRAWDPDLERYVAIKLIHPIEGVRDALKDRVLREGRAIARISHTNVVSVFSVEVHDAQVGLCMELVAGKTLDDIVRNHGVMGAHEAMMVGQSVCRALSAVHAANLVHRDIKARNVMRADGGRIVLMDFGAGEALRDNAAGRAGSRQGTPIYMAPEALAGRPGTVASDIYSTGVLLYFLVSGRYPFEGATTEELERAHARGQRHFLMNRRPDLPVQFVRVIEKALDPDPRRRHDSAWALMMDLVDASEHVQPEPGPGILDQIAAFLSRRKQWVRAATMAAAAVVVLLVMGFINSFAYRYTFELDAGLVNEGPLDWLRWGRMSAVAPLALMALVFVVVLVASEVVALVRRVSTRADRRLRIAGAAIARQVQRLGMTPSSALACLLVVFAIAFDAWVIWQFSALLNALVYSIDDATPDMLARLAPSNFDEQSAYRQLLSLGVLALAYGLYKVRRMSSERGERVKPQLIGAVAVAIAVNVVLLDFPYRVIWQADGYPVVYENAKCHVVAEGAGSAQLLCGTRTPRTFVVPANDPALQKRGSLENVFEQFSLIRP
jgi:hypothetical protein